MAAQQQSRAVKPRHARPQTFHAVQLAAEQGGGVAKARDAAQLKRGQTAQRQRAQQRRRAHPVRPGDLWHAVGLGLRLSLDQHGPQRLARLAGLLCTGLGALLEGVEDNRQKQVEHKHAPQHGRRHKVEPRPRRRARHESIHGPGPAVKRDRLQDGRRGGEDRVEGGEVAGGVGGEVHAP
eukprot:scaffold32569_cov112-Isochrysis_galbana.AAC.1